MRTFSPFLALFAACSGPAPSGSPPPYAPPPGFVVDERMAYTDGLHNENTDLIALDDRILLVFRGGETGQIGSDLAHLNLFGSTDAGATWSLQAQVDAGALPGGRDIRDPKFVSFKGRLFLYATSRLPGGHYRDLLGEAWCVRSESTDNGQTWTTPEKTFSDLNESSSETFSDFWRFTEHTSATGTTLYALGYDDGDTQVALFASDDGVAWEKRSIVVDSYDDVPSEAELQFFGDTAVAIVRMDNQGILQDGQSAICTAHDPFTTWECGRRIEARLDGPKWLSQDFGDGTRNFVVARKHLPCTFKRTAIYELRGDLANPSSPIDVCEIEELPSAGDTAYTALAPLGGTRFLTSWYSSTIPAEGDVAWLEGTFTPADIWVANVDFDLAPIDECNAPPPKLACEPPPLSPGDPAAAPTGDFAFTLSPVIYPSQTLTLTATNSATEFDLQPLDGTTGEPVGDPWVATKVSAGDGTFTAAFDTVSLPETSWPLLADPFLTLHELVITGAETSPDAFCGYIDGYAQVLGVSPSDRIDLAGSTFGATRPGAPTASSCGG